MEKIIRLSISDWLKLGNTLGDLKQDEVLYITCSSRSPKRYFKYIMPYGKTHRIIVGVKPDSPGTTHHDCEYSLHQLFKPIDISSINSSVEGNVINHLKQLESFIRNGYKEYREVENISGTYNKVDVTKIVNITWKEVMGQFLDGENTERLIRSVCDIDNDKIRAAREAWLRKLKLK